jgi:agmatinase
VIHEGHVLGKNYVQVGLRARPDIDTFKWMREQGMNYHTMVEVEKIGWDRVMEAAVNEAKRNTKSSGSVSTSTFWTRPSCRGRERRFRAD